MTRRNRRLLGVATFMGAAIALVGVLAAPALAAPEFEVKLERDQAVVSRSDERVDYTASVENVAPPGGPHGVGDKLTCVGTPPSKGWGPPVESFEFEWRRNGAVIPGASGESYVATAADEGKAIQCLVHGTNARGTAVSAALPAVVVEPEPATDPPTPSNPASFAALPRVTDELDNHVEIAPASVKRFCHPPENWEGGGTFTYQWLLNGDPIPGPEAQTAEYQPTAADEVKVLQCEIIGTNVGGSVVGVSIRNVVGTQGAPFLVNEFPNPQPSASVELGNTASGVVTLELELPGGSGTYSYEATGTGWVCNTIPASGAQHAKAVCTRLDILPPGESYPQIKVIAALGSDAPDVAVAKATAFGGGAVAPASATDEFTFSPFREFGLAPGTFNAAVLDCDENDYTQAGGHPCVGVGNFVLEQKRTLTAEAGGGGTTAPIEHLKQLFIDIPPGFVGNALAAPELCSGADAVHAGTCPPASGVGVVVNSVRSAPATPGELYTIKPEYGTPAQFAFVDPLGNVYTLTPRLRANDGYAVSLELASAPKVDLLEAKGTICGFGVKPNVKEGCREPGEPGANPVPLFTNPTRCGEPRPVTRTYLDSWEHSGAKTQDGRPDLSDPNWKGSSFTNAEIAGCDEVEFEPSMKALSPSSKQADSPTGLDVELTMPTDGLEEADGISQANLRRAKVTFPVGMAINGSAGSGLGSCSASQVKLKTNLPIECPDSSKIGSVEIETPLLDETLKGAVYIAKQGDIEGALTGFYLVFDSKKDGILVKIPAKVEPDPVTGQLTVIVDESPEQPFSTVRMHFPGGPRATLLTPPRCGKYAIASELTPWSGGKPVIQTSSFEVTEGPNGGPCPKGNLEPKLSAGSEIATAGQTSPFNFRLFREDGTDRFASLSMKTPLGLSAYLKGVPYCPDSAINSISGEVLTGQTQIEHPSCPAASQIGTAIAGAGAGPSPFFVNTGKVYLAGPYKGAPVSIVAVAPAVAGPLDLGNVVVRNAIHVDPESAQITIQSDPIPTILHGILPDIRDIRVMIDRPHFTLNPTSCEEKSVKVDVKGESGQSASVSNRFQVGGCEKLGFKPKLTTTLSGPTKRGGHPSLKGVLAPRPGDANLKSAVVTIPRSEFLDQAHIRTICTRVQFAAGACPKGSIYGHATAITPLLDQPLSGPVYLRSSSHKLPDLVVAVKGPDYQPIEAAVVGRIDSIKGQIRANFEATPDVPLTKVTIQMQGGRKGLLVNSRDICSRAFRASLELEGHNGSAYDATPVLKNGKCGAGRRKGGKQRR